MAADGPILIAGGGIGGLALAIALAQQGHRSIVLEQRESFTTAGAGIQLGPNGVRVLQRLGVADALAPMVGIPQAIRVHAGKTGTELANLPLGSWIAERHSAPYWVAHRGDVLAALHSVAAAVPLITLRAGFALSSAAQRSGEVEVRDADGACVTGNALVGADGLWSTVRDSLAPDCIPQFAGATATRCVLPTELAGPLAMPAVGVWLSPGAHVVHYPVRRGTETAVVVIAREPWQARDWDAQADGTELARHVQAFDTPLADRLRSVRDWRKWALFDLPMPARWCAGRIALLGDAVHPMLPYLAQGGALALEDALVLAQCVGARAGDIPGAFAAFEGLRRPRAGRVQAASRRQGRIYHLPPPLSWARDTVLRVASGQRLMASYDWLYAWRADAGR